MLDWIQGKPAGLARSVISEVLRRKPVRDFVNHDRHNQNSDVKNSVYCLHNCNFNDSIQLVMKKTCAITNKSSIVGGGYSNRTRATKFNPTGKVRKYPNLQKKRIFVPELNKTVQVEISARGLRTLKKNGAYATLLKAGLLEAK